MVFASGRVVAALAGAVAALTAIPLALVTIAPSASAATNQFLGVNWARAGDNFTAGPLVLYGLSSSDSYTTVRAKADAVFAGFERNLGANTVRLPINTYSVGTTMVELVHRRHRLGDRPGLQGHRLVLGDGTGVHRRPASPTPAAFDPCGTPSSSKYGANSLSTSSR